MTENRDIRRFLCINSIKPAWLIRVSITSGVAEIGGIGDSKKLKGSILNENKQPCWSNFIEYKSTT